MKKIRFFMVLTIVICLCACSTSKLDELLEQGAKYLGEQNYEEAIITFDKAIQIDIKEPATYLKISEAYSSFDLKQMSLDYLLIGWENTKDNSIKEKLLEFGISTEIPDSLQIEMLKQIYQAMENKDFSSICKIGKERIKSSLSQYSGYSFDGNELRIGYDGKGLKLMFEDRVDGIYFGGIENGRANGDGYCISGEIKNNGEAFYKLFSGAWSNNLPDGEGKIYEKSGYGWTRNVVGTFSNDMFDGEIQEKINQGEGDIVFEYCCQNGKLVLDSKWKVNEEGNHFIESQGDAFGRMIFENSNESVYAVYNFNYD